jgi:hypothetical protein
MTTTTRTKSAPTPEADWMRSLTESVSVLGAAAYELFSAQQQARHAAWASDPVRIVPFPGLVAVRGTEPARPHDEVLWQLTDLHLGLAHHLKQLYENAALAYAYGAATAVQAVLRAETPARVELVRGADGRYRIPFDSLPDLSQSVALAHGGRELAELREAVLVLAEADDGPEADADIETLYADTAYTYGEQAKAVLQHLLHHAAKHHHPQAG